MFYDIRFKGIGIRKSEFVAKTQFLSIDNVLSTFIFFISIHLERSHSNGLQPLRHFCFVLFEIKLKSVMLNFGKMVKFQESGVTLDIELLTELAERQ